MLFLLQQFEFEKFTSKLNYQPLNLKKNTIRYNQS